MSLRRSVAAAALLATVSIPSAAWASALDSPWVLKPGEFYSELSGSFFAANSFYGEQEEGRFSLGGKLDERVVRSSNEFGWKKWASVWISVPFVSRSFSPFTGGNTTATGLGDLDVGLRVALLRGSLPAALSLGWTAPLGDNRKLFPGTSGEGGIDLRHVPAAGGSNFADTSLYFDQGMQSLSAALALGGTAGKRAYWTLGGAFVYRFLEIGQSDETTNGVVTTFRHNAKFAGGDASVGIWVTQSLLLTGAFHGEWVMSQSAIYDGDETRELDITRMLTGPRLTYRVDERMDVFAGSWHTPTGRNVLHHDQYYCGIAWKQTGLDRLAGMLGGTKAH